MLARKLISEGVRRCPRPWRARNATRFPSTIPVTIASEGSPKGVLKRTSLTAERPFIEYRPLPPMIPTLALLFLAALFAFAFKTDVPFPVVELRVEVYRFGFYLG